MNEELDSQLSAMFDDELPTGECELLARRLSRDAALQSRWGRYAAIGAAMRGDLRLHMRKSDRRCLAGGRGKVEGREVVRRAEPGVGRWRRVDCDGGSDDDGGHRHHDEEQDEQLLAPFAPEETPGPADHGPAGRDATGTRGRHRTGGRPLENAEAH